MSAAARPVGPAPAGASVPAPASRVGVVPEIAALALARLAAIVGVLWSGFRAVSDDDYARVVIAERLVAAPKLDPSGTSWLPFPFWGMGATMGVLGRSLAVARAASVGLALASGVVLHVSLVRWGVPRRERVLGLAVVFVLPWTLWTSAATVPEACTAALIASAVLLAALPDRLASGRTGLAAGALVCAATLSRYEAWPISVLVAARLAARASRARPAQGVDRATRTAWLGGAVLALSGPALWMLWNQIAHGSATHFLFRVARFKRALGGPELPATERLLAYPKLLVVWFPETAALAAVLAVAARRGRSTRPPLPRAAALVSGLAILAFLAYGNLQDGAPTHHAERALLPIAFLVIPLGVADLGAAGRAGQLAPFVATRGARSLALGLGVLVGLLAGALALTRYSAPPGTGEASRARQIARGTELRASGARALVVTPCAYEHFALIAAFGAPEAVTIEAPVPRTAGSGDPNECPTIRTLR